MRYFAISPISSPLPSTTIASKDHADFPKDDQAPVQKFKFEEILAADPGNAITGALNEKFTLKSHMDSVRNAHILPGSDVLATVSEDCMVKLWSLEGIESRYTKSNGNVEPFLTLRGHTGPLLAVAGLVEERKSAKNKNLLFTAGDEGCIRVWDVPSISDVN